MRKGWHLFLVIAAIIAIGFFYLGCKIQKFYDSPTVDSTSKTNQWQPPELDKRLDKVIVNYFPAQGVYEITNLSKAVPFEVNNSPWPQQYQGYHPFSSHVMGGRLFIDLEIPTRTKPILIKNGEIIDLPAGWQWNGNSNALEIVNAEVIPVFQEFFTNVNTVSINGAVRSGDKVFFQDYNHQIQFDNFQLEFLEMGDNIKLAQYFSYPAVNNPGVLFNK